MPEVDWEEIEQRRADDDAAYLAYLVDVCCKLRDHDTDLPPCPNSDKIHQMIQAAGIEVTLECLDTIVAQMRKKVCDNLSSMLNSNFIPKEYQT